MLQPAADRSALRSEWGLPEGSPTIGLLPGSRGMERTLLGPRMLQAAELVQARLPAARFLWSSLGPSADSRRLTRQIDASGLFTRVEQSHRILRASDLIVVKMGTVTVEAAAALVPMVTTYDGPWLAKFIFDAVQHHAQPFYAMPNIMAGHEVVPEVVPRNYRESVTPQMLAEKVLEVAGDGPAKARMLAGLAEIRAALGETGVSQRAAEAIAQLASQHAGRPTGA